MVNNAGTLISEYNSTYNEYMNFLVEQKNMINVRETYYKYDFHQQKKNCTYIIICGNKLCSKFNNKSSYKQHVSLFFF